MTALELNELQRGLPARVSKLDNQLVLEGAVVVRRPSTGAGFIVFLDRTLGTEQKVGDLRQERYLIQPTNTFRFLQ